MFSPVRDAAADETRRLELPVPPAMDGLRARALLGVGADGEPLLAFETAAVVDLRRRVEEVIVRLGQSADVGEVGAQEEPELGENGPAKRKHPFLPALAVDRSSAARRHLRGFSRAFCLQIVG
jgi:hypothetical protein